MKKFMMSFAVFAVAALGFSGYVEAASKPLPVIKLCTGGKDGNYYFAGTEIERQARGVIDVQVVQTKGSWDNLQKIKDGECDAAVIQADAWFLWGKKNPSDKLDLDRADTLYNEYVHLYCNRNVDISRVTTLRSGKYTVALGPNGSGTHVTWQSFIEADKRYAKVPTVPFSGIQAKFKVKDGGDVQCALYISGLRSSFMQGVDDEGSKIKLVDVNDSDFDNAKDNKGQRIYKFHTISRDTYPRLQHRVGSVEVVTVPAILVVKTAWIEANQELYQSFLEFQSKAQKIVRQRVGQ